MEKIFQTIWEMSLFAVPVILILAICSNLLGKRYGARWRYLVWLVVAIRLCVPIQLSLPGRMEIMQVQVPSVQSGTREVLAQRTPDYFVQKEPNEPIQQPSVEQTGGVYGKVVGIDDEDTLRVEVAPKVVITISRYAVQSLLK